MGEALVPIFFGIGMDAGSSITFPIMTLLFSCLMWILYIAMYQFAVKMVEKINSIRDESVPSVTVSLVG